MCDRRSVPLFLSGCVRSPVCVWTLGTGVCLLCLFCVCACVPTTIYPQTQSFLFLVSTGSGRRESRLARPEGVGREAPQLWGPVASSQPRSGARLPAHSPRIPAAGVGGRAALGRWAVGRGLGAGSPPATWHVGACQGHCAGAGTACQRSPGAGRGFWRRVLFRPQHSCPRVSESPGAPPPLYFRLALGGSAQDPRSRLRIPLPGSGSNTSREGQSRAEETRDPLAPAGSPSLLEPAHSRCAFQMHCPPPVCSCSSP